jgi:putative transposase
MAGPKSSTPIRAASSPATPSPAKLADAGIRISMDGRGRWMDNVFIERLWRSLKYECVFLNAFETGAEARTGIGRWIDFYNQRRPHSALGDRTPDEAYAIEIQQENLAA